MRVFAMSGEHLAGQVLRAADTGGGVGQLARLGPRQRDQLAQVVRRQTAGCTTNTCGTDETGDRR